MNAEQFIRDSRTLHRLFHTYCSVRHRYEQKMEETKNIYSGEQFLLTQHVKLCSSCRELYFYALKRLEECPYDPKPCCRKCKSVCYGKTEWKNMRKVMLTSGLIQGVSRIAGYFKFPMK